MKDRKILQKIYFCANSIVHRLFLLPLRKMWVIERDEALKVATWKQEYRI